MTTRKPRDTSLGDALNWEWLIKCAETTKNANVLIVSRDSDYGLPQGENSILNDWLKAEFEARVRPRRKIELTPKLTVALKKLAEVVTAEDEAVETAVLEASKYRINLQPYLPLEPRQTTFFVAPAAAGPVAKNLFANLAEMTVSEYPEIDGEVAFALSYPVSYEQGMSYGARLSGFAKSLKGKRELPSKFL